MDDSPLTLELYEKYSTLCECGMRTVMARIQNLSQEMEFTDKRNPYAAIESRIKSYDSVLEKCARRGYPQTLDGVRKNIHDVAGIRIVTLFKDDIYRVRDALMRQPSMEVIEHRDYVKNPKSNGYRSYHLIVSMQVYFQEVTRSVPVEIQIRTKAMDVWASLEHYCYYKNGRPTEDAPEAFDELAKILDAFDDKAIELRGE